MLERTVNNLIWCTGFQVFHCVGMVFTRFAIQRAPQNNLATSLFRLLSSCSISIQRMTPNSWSGPCRRQARLRCKWEVWKNTVMLLRLAGTSILFFVCHKRYPFQENALLLILKELIYFELFNSDIFSRSLFQKSTCPLGTVPITAPDRQHITYSEDNNSLYNCCIHHSTRNTK
jgi:hypothetical protein